MANPTYSNQREAMMTASRVQAATILLAYSMDSVVAAT